MNIIHDIYISILTSKGKIKNNEIWASDSTKIELLGDNGYREIHYYEDSIWWEEEWKDVRLHGKFICYESNGNIGYEVEYKDGKMVKRIK